MLPMAERRTARAPSASEGSGSRRYSPVTGRPTKRSPERVAAILSSLRVGNTRRAAAAAGDISEDTLARWAATDAEFRGAIEKAEAEAERRFLARVAAAADDPKTWTAAAWWLERRRADEFGRHERVDLNVDMRREAERLGAELGLDPDEIMAEAERYIRKGGAT